MLQYDSYENERMTGQWRENRFRDETLDHSRNDLLRTFLLRVA
jgi:hypothetical protein